jgi:lysozyme
MGQQLSKQGAVFVRLHEGFVGRWYLDPVGVPTIGIGFTWRSAAFREWWAANRPGQAFARGATITRHEAEAALIQLCAREYGAAVGRFLGREVEQHVFDGMVSPVYNLGPGSLNWKWAAAVRRGNLPEAAARLRSTGTTAEGKRLPGLVRRRKEEALLLEKGIYTGVAVAGLHDTPSTGLKPTPSAGRWPTASCGAGSADRRSLA